MDIKQKILKVEKTLTCKEFGTVISKRDANDDSKNDNRTIDISFASETPFLRYFGYEIIDIAKIDLSILNNKAPLLFNHWNDDYIGVVEKAWIGDDNRAYATVRFDTHELAEKIYTSIKNGILSKVSFGYEIVDGYQIFDIQGTEAFRVAVICREISIVSDPADQTVGYGRSNEDNSKNNPIKEVVMKLDEQVSKIESQNQNGEIQVVVNPQKDDKVEITPPIENKETVTTVKEEVKPKDLDLPPVEKMEDGKIVELDINFVGKKENSQKTFENEKNISDNVNINIKSNNTEKKMDRKEVDNEIIRIGRQFKCEALALEFLEKSETSVKSFMEAVIESRSSAPSKETQFARESSSEGYSTASAIKSLFSGKHNQGITGDISKELRSRYNLEERENTIVVPLHMLRASTPTPTSTVNSANPASAANLIANIMSDTYINPLENALVLAKAGARTITLDRDYLTMPRFNESAVIEYISEDQQADQSELDVDNVEFKPHTLSGSMGVSRQMQLLSHFDINNIVVQRLLTPLYNKMDVDGLFGTGAGNSVLGIANQNGVAQANYAGVTFPNLLNLAYLVNNANGVIDPNSTAFVGNGSVGALARGTQKGQGIDMIINDDNKMAGYKWLETNAIKNSQDNVSKVIFGDFSQVYIATWGAVEIQFNPYTDRTGKNQITVFLSYDVQVLHPQSFAVGNFTVA